MSWWIKFHVLGRCEVFDSRCTPLLLFGDHMQSF